MYNIICNSCKNDLYYLTLELTNFYHITNPARLMTPAFQTLMSARPLHVRASVRTLTVVSPVAATLALSWRLTLSAVKVGTWDMIHCNYVGWIPIHSLMSKMDEMNGMANTSYMMLHEPSLL